jgi:hypothetical protein
MTAYVLREGEDTILVDPLSGPLRFPKGSVVAGENESLLAALDEIVRGRVRILVTTPFHVRGSELLWRRWRDRHEVTIFGHEHCATRLDDRSAFRPLRGGETLEGGLRAHAIGRPRRAEIPFERRRTAPWPSATPWSRSTGSCACGRGTATANVAVLGTSSASCPRWTP